ncbi:MAG: YihY/virulence factor BrkB family protein [Acidobacteriota bacterium]|nr:YihY/virulence factor BrkB family protein [Acidobacteriota bacterium]
MLRKTYTDWDADEAPRMGASLAFYTILSLSPLVILTVAIVALAFGQSNAQQQILDQVQGVVGTDGSKAVRDMLDHAQKPSSSITASAIALFTLFFGASGVFGELRFALNKIWEAKPKDASGFMGMVRQRFFSFGMVLAIGFLLMVSLVLSAGLAAAGKFAGGLLPLPGPVLQAVNFLISFLGIAVLFMLIFKYVPETKVAWRDVWVGGLVTALFFTVGKFLIGLYLGKAGVGSAYGAAGSLIVVIVWVYYSAQIFFFGAEFTHVSAKQGTPKL